MTGRTPERSEARLLVPALMFIALVVAAVASLGTPLITIRARRSSSQGQAAPGGRTVALQREHGFAVVDTAGRTLIERTGEADFAWQVPPKAWSPDGRFLLVWRNDARGVHKIPIVDYSTGLERVERVPYTKTGTPLVRAELHVVEVATGRVTQVPPGKAETYDWLAGWRPGGKEALLLHLSRDGKRLDLEALEPATGKTRLVLREERPETFVAALEFSEGTSGPAGWEVQVTPLDDDRRFLWMSERDGWRHVYLYDYAGKLERQLTRGAFPWSVCLRSRASTASSCPPRGATSSMATPAAPSHAPGRCAPRTAGQRCGTRRRTRAGSRSWASSPPRASPRWPQTARRLFTASSSSLGTSTHASATPSSITSTQVPS